MRAFRTHRLYAHWETRPRVSVTIYGRRALCPQHLLQQEGQRIDGSVGADVPVPGSPGGSAFRVISYAGEGETEGLTVVEGPGGGRTGGQGPSEPEAWGLTLRAEESH